MHVFRLTRQKCSQELSGKGAAIKGARWNSPGYEMIYTAGNRSLAMAEVAVYYTYATFPNDYVMLTIRVSEHIPIEKLSAENLPPDWNIFPHPRTTQQIGDNFLLSRKHCILQIPSVVTKGDFNFLINPHHPDFLNNVAIIEGEAFPFDQRLFK